MEQVLIRTVKSSDLQNIAVLHKERFSDHFLGKYSIPVISAYYQEFINECIFLVSEHNGNINGFVMGGDSHKLNNAKARFLKKNRVLYSFDTLIRPWIYKDVVSRIPSFLKISNQPVSTQQTAIRLLSIAISKDVEGYGISKQLLDSFEIAIWPIPDLSDTQ
jgi:ribosomal protein S18 acetylase RimI-like enzyme